MGGNWPISSIRGAASPQQSVAGRTLRGYRENDVNALRRMAVPFLARSVVGRDANNFDPRPTSDLDYIVTVARQSGIRGDEVHGLMHGLGEQQAIEWVRMRRCDLAGTHRVFPCDRER